MGWFEKRPAPKAHSDFYIQRISSRGKSLRFGRYGDKHSETLADFDVDDRGRVWGVGKAYGSDYTIQGETISLCPPKRCWGGRLCKCSTMFIFVQSN